VDNPKELGYVQGRENQPVRKSELGDEQGLKLLAGVKARTQRMKPEYYNVDHGLVVVA
jgi:hypothetical protein